MDRRWRGYAWAVAAAVMATVAGLAIAPRFDLVNVAMVYLLAVVGVAMRYSRGPSIAASVLCVAAFDYVFVPPQGTFTVDDAQYLLTFAIMLAVAVVVSGLAGRVRRDAEERSRMAIETETERIRSTLLASISHDLRTPLSVISGASSSLAEGGERLAPGERASLARSIFERSSDMAAHVDKILQMTRLESNAIVIERDWASLGEIAASALARLGERLEGHRLLMELPDDLPLVRVDAPLVEQALGNLLENAARHTPPDTVVRLRAQPEGGEVVVSVEDYGGRLREADLERVFAKFQRGETEGGAGGVGLGLSIVRAVARLHGGRAWAERLAGGGAAFRFTLPLEAMPAVPAEEPGA